MTELLPCPFCGAPANKTRFEKGATHSRAITQIQCVNDDQCAVTVDVKSINEAIAIKAWNTRAAVSRSGERGK